MGTGLCDLCFASPIQERLSAVGARAAMAYVAVPFAATAVGVGPSPMQPFEKMLAFSILI